MGDVYIVRRGFKHGEGDTVLLKGASEFLNSETAFNFVNGNIGIFFYERDLWKPEQLKKDLIKIVQAIDTIDLPEYWDVDGKLKKPKRSKHGKIVIKYE